MWAWAHEAPIYRGAPGEELLGAETATDLWGAARAPPQQCTLRQAEGGNLHLQHPSRTLSACLLWVVKVRIAVTISSCCLFGAFDMTEHNPRDIAHWVSEREVTGKPSDTVH